MFDHAIATARSLNVDMTDIFAHLTTQCLRLVRRPEAFLSVSLTIFGGCITDSDHAARMAPQIGCSLTRSPPGLAALQIVLGAISVTL